MDAENQTTTQTRPRVKKMFSWSDDNAPTIVDDGITVDEYQTIRGRRFFGINVHDSLQRKTWKTGLVRIFGSCAADKMVDAVKEHLISFGIDFERDLVASTQDGAAVNKKYIRIFNVIGQFCFNHAIHLAITDTLYKKLSNTQEEDDFADTLIYDTDDFDNVSDLEFLENEITEEIHYHDVLKQARKIVKFIKLSSVRNHIFQSKVIAKYNKEIELKLDVKTRWNSIPDLLQPIIETKDILIETFNELNANEMIENLNFEALSVLFAAMVPVKLAVEALSNENATLLTADTVIEFMYRKLSEMENTISKELLDNLKKRINERWNHDLMNLLKCLKDPTSVPSRNTIIFAGKLSTRLFGLKRNIEESESIENESQ
ncbi:hypothetical protein PVAND_001805 [Polypedilum vanderplanki]|uniref:Uncharacterized protein n=1 Tax=Polypedilum vanderplanki TaxID=319348 RepID=A0A9J6BP33_POLVA|nr:hypothetical protein PVAND_001805 [Polypedilum vanderplanki]